MATPSSAASAAVSDGDSSRASIVGFESSSFPMGDVTTMLTGIVQVLRAPKDWPDIRPNRGAHGLPVRLLALRPQRSDDFCAELVARVLEARPDVSPLRAC